MADYSTIKQDLDSYIDTLGSKVGLEFAMSSEAYDQLVIQTGGKKIKKYRGISIQVVEVKPKDSTNE